MARLRINPGGMLTPGEVVGRDLFVSEVWRALDRQSVLLTAERRMGKTSVLLKLEAEPLTERCVIKRTLQGIRTPEEFVRKLVADVDNAIPGLIRKSIGDRLRKAGVKSIGSTPISVEFEPATPESWKDVVTETFRVLDEDVDELVVLLWDEAPQMIADIDTERGSGVAREMLDVLRAARESHRGIRMVLSGSLGIHHVVAALRSEGGMWAPTHDMRALDLPPLAEDDAVFLAGELLRNDDVACDDRDAVASAIASEVDCMPYYIHQTALRLRDRGRAGERMPVDVATVEKEVEDAICDPLDPWELGHYVSRTPVYYGNDADLVNAVLDIVARDSAPLDIAMIRERLAAHGPPPEIERLRELVDLLCRDYYLCARPGYVFLRSLVRRAWLARRPAV